MSTLQIRHETRYDYPSPVTSALHLAYLRPLVDEAQSLLAHALHVDPAPDEQLDERDPYGNLRQRLALLAGHRSLTVRAESRVRLRPRFAALQPAASPAWETVRDRLHYVAGAAHVAAGEFAQPSPYVPRLDALRELAQPSFGPGRPLAEAAIDAMQRLHRDFEYLEGSTGIDTPLTQVLVQRQGVCQDFAHLLIGMLRRIGLPARYVSGYMLTRAPDSGQALVGADATHAWVQVWAPDTAGVPADGWLDLDPTNDCVPGTGHVRLAVGRDYGDVTPLRGVIRGGAGHRLTVAVQTQLLGDAD